MAQQAAADWQIYDVTGQRKYLNHGEVMRFLAAADRLTDSRRLLCYVLAYTGCRISEALALTRQQIDPVDGVVLTTLKRRRVVHRRVPLPPFLLHQLRAVKVGEDGRLWHLHRVTAWRCVADVMGRAGVAGPMATIRGLRHAFGVRCATRGVPPSLIQRWMGHASLRMTMVYIDAIGTEERRFASLVWWQGASEGTTAPTRPSQQMRRDMDALRRENDQYRAAIHAFFSHVRPWGDAVEMHAA